MIATPLCIVQKHRLFVMFCSVVRLVYIHMYVH